MVVGLALAAVQMGMALPTGFLFGVGYGTGVRVGYEQVYPLLFPKGARQTTSELTATMKGMNTVYDAIGGKDASRMGIAVGITNAGEILNNPDFRVLEQLELSSSGLTSSSSNRSRFGLDQESAQEAVSSDINEFNQRTGSEQYARYRTYSISQLNNIISSSTNQESIRIANIVLQEKLQSGGGTSTDVPPPPHQQNEDVSHLTSDSAWLAWNETLTQLKVTIQKARNTATTQSQAERGWTERSDRVKRTIIQDKLNRNNAYKDARTKLLRISQDFRNPNNNIRNYVLKLRQELANGKWK